MPTERLELFADYFQFLLLDEHCEDDFSVVWTPEALQRMLAVGDTSVSVGTLRNVTVSIEVHIVEARPTIDLSKFDHAAEASFSVPSGQLAVLGCTDYLPDAKRLSLVPGHYQVLSLASGVDTIVNEWDPAEDLYTVYLWPGAPITSQLLKHWKGESA